MSYGCAFRRSRKAERRPYMIERDNEGRIQCMECGKFFSFLAPHLHCAHQMNASEYRERWKIPRQVPLTSIAHSEQCRANTLRRIRCGELCPVEQVAMMADARNKPRMRDTSTALSREAASRVARTHQIWKSSPVIKTAPKELKDAAVRRMVARKVTGEKVEDIAISLHISVSRLYHWLAASKT